MDWDNCVGTYWLAVANAWTHSPVLHRIQRRLIEILIAARSLDARSDYLTGLIVS
jgi:hypothetical protein